MIQFNLLPDVKLDYLRAQRSRRLVISVAALAVIVSLAVLIGVLALGGLQKKHLADLNRDIVSDSKKLQAKPQIDKILTVQNQLKSLSSLHDDKPAASRLFDYLNQVTPADVDITSFTMDFNENTAEITGTSKALSAVNKYADTLKFTTYKVAGDDSTPKAFSNVVLSSFGVASGTAQGDNVPKTTYSLTLSYVPDIFDITQKVTLAVPSLITTRAQLAQPNELFTKPPTAETSGTAGGSN